MTSGRRFLGAVLFLIHVLCGSGSLFAERAQSTVLSYGLRRKLKQHNRQPTQAAPTANPGQEEEMEFILRVGRVAFVMLGWLWFEEPVHCIV